VSPPRRSLLTLATRRSALALAQSRAFMGLLVARTPGLAVEELQVVTSGDKDQTSRLSDIGGKGLFVKELEEALYARTADLAVHSIKDVPAELAPGLTIGCVPPREDPRDALVGRGGAKLADLPSGARVGTSSLRRAVCLRRARPDLVIEPLRGNVDTRLRRVDEGAFDAAVLALAGLRRLGLDARATEVLDPAVSLPAVGQGALGIECREGDDDVLAVLAPLADHAAWTCVAAERAVLHAVGGDCKTPVAAHARREGDALVLDGLLAEPDGSRLRTGRRRVAFPSEGGEAGRAEAARAGRDLGEELLRG
jgi:hydroxymethylbilane synthase